MSISWLLLTLSEATGNNYGSENMYEHEVVSGNEYEYENDPQAIYEELLEGVLENEKKKKSIKQMLRS